MAKPTVRYVCASCGTAASRWVGRCPGCGEWNTLSEERAPSRGRAATGKRQRAAAPRTVPLSEAAATDAPRQPVGIAEVDRVLGGGFVAGSVVLVGGDPGVGKSTLLLQVLSRLGGSGARTLYVTGEESLAQTGLRARRIGAASGEVDVVAETSVEAIVALVEEARPAVAVVDSVQTLACEEVESAPGSVSQLRESTARLVDVAKRTGTALALVGHVTKDGAIAGPKVLEHMVDTVLYFEGERGGAHRTLRTVKNRFGSATEVGVFEMRTEGLVEVANPSALLLSERPTGAPGSVVVATAEGSRPLLCEVQALVADASGPPRRTATGVDPQRVQLLLAVLDRVAGEPVLSRDVFVNVAGGMRIEETAADLGVCVAVASSARGLALPEGTVVFGEVGLTGEVRSVSRPEARIAEAARLGFRRVVLPKAASANGAPQGVVLTPVSTVRAALAEITLLPSK